MLIVNNFSSRYTKAFERTHLNETVILGSINGIYYIIFHSTLRFSERTKCV